MQSNIEDAISSYKISINLNPNKSEVYYNLGNAYSMQEKFELAEQNYEKSLSLNRNN